MTDNVLITGSLGFIGKHIEGGKIFYGDINDYGSLFNQAENTVGIVHLACKSNKRKCEKDIRATLYSNLFGMCNVLDVALARNIWVLFISTYQVKEQTIYGLSKLMGEEICRLYQKKGVKIHIIRFPIVYGKNENSDKLVSKFIAQLKQGIEPKIETDEKFYFLYVTDAIKIIENEVEVLQTGFGKKYSLIDLSEGIKKCLLTE